MKEALLSDIWGALRGNHPDILKACGLLMRLGMTCGSVDVEPLGDERIKFVLENSEPRVFNLSGSVGRFRMVLGKLGEACIELSKLAENKALGQGRYTTEGPYGLLMKDATWAPVPGSPLYSLDGYLTVEDETGVAHRLHIEMENTGQRQRLLISRGEASSRSR